MNPTDPAAKPPPNSVPPKSMDPPLRPRLSSAYPERPLLDLPGRGPAFLKVVVVDVLGIFFTALIVCTYGMAGMQFLSEVASTKLSEVALPFMSWMEDYDGFDRMTIGHVFCLLIAVAVWRSWVFLFQATMNRERYFRQFPWDPQLFRAVVGTLAVALILADAIFFYIANAQTSWGWGDSFTFSFGALILTVSYVCVMVFISLVSFTLESSLKEKPA